MILLEKWGTVLLRKWMASSFSALLFFMITSLWYVLRTLWNIGQLRNPIDIGTGMILIYSFPIILVYGGTSSLLIEAVTDRLRQKDNLWMKSLLYFLAACFTELPNEYAGFPNIIGYILITLFYGILVSLLIEQLTKQLPKRKGWMKWVLYFLPKSILYFSVGYLAYWMFLYLESESSPKADNFFPLVTIFATLFFIIDEILIRTTWMKKHKWLLIGLSLIPVGLLAWWFLPLL